MKEKKVVQRKPARLGAVCTALMLALAALCAALTFSSTSSASAETLPAVNFKADYGFTRHSVTRADVGLEENQFYYQLFEQQNYWSFADDRMDYDLFTAQLAIEGMLNREEAVLLLNQNTFSGVPELWTDSGDAHFYRYYTDPARSGPGRPAQEGVELGYLGLARMVEKFGRYFNGVILYDYDCTPANPSVNYVLAYNLANANFCIPIKKDFYYSNIASFEGIPIVADISNTGLTEKQTYEWILNNLLGRKGEQRMLNKYAANSLNLTFADHRAANSDWANIMAVDFAFSTKTVLFNLSVFKGDRYEANGLCDGNGDIDPVLDAMLAALDGNGEPPLMLGWNSPEPEWVERISRYGIAVECTSSSRNTSFHAAMEPYTKTREDILTTGLKQKRDQSKLHVETYENKVYIAFLANEGDAMKTRTNGNNHAWYSVNSSTGTSRLTRAEEGNKEKFPISWAITATQLRYTPALIEYYYETATDQDQFYGAPTGGAGYLNLGNNAYVDEYIATTNKYFNLLDIHYADFWYADASSIDRYVEGVEGLRGVTLDVSDSEPDGSFNYIGDKGMPALRYAGKRFGWMTRGDDYNSGTYWVWDGSSNHLNAQTFFLDFENEKAKNPSGPVFIPYYGMEDDALKLFWDEVINDPRWDDDRYQVVDMGNLIELAAQYQQDIGNVHVSAGTSSARYLDRGTLTDAMFWEDAYSEAEAAADGTYETTDEGVSVTGGGVTFTARIVSDLKGITLRASGQTGDKPRVRISDGVNEIDVTAETGFTGEGSQTFAFDFTGDAALSGLRSHLTANRSVTVQLYGGAGPIVYEDIGIETTATNVFSDAMLASADGWNKGSGTITPLEGGGLRIENATTYELINRSNVRLPGGSRWIRITLGQVEGYSDDFGPQFKITGDINGFGKNSDSVMHLGSASDVTLYYPLDLRIANKPEKNWMLQLGFGGKGMVEFKKIEFLTEAQYRAEYDGWQIGDPDVVYDDDRYDVDKNDDGIRDGDEVTPVSNLRLEGDTLYWDYEGNGRFVVQVYDPEEKLIGTLIANNRNEQSLRSLDIADFTGYRFDVYVSVTGKPNSEIVSIRGSAATPSEPEPGEGGCGCNSSVAGASIAAGMAAFAGFAAVLFRRRRSAD